ncbi:FG-GAP-like repeat-containing protein [Chryseolinea lacunae]|uniref:T9SS type A sorting domain-containing protein n=1 Tax=Chryseolinea lacunae TaxID=2801331 RepID=A0ABS1KSA4_9BACT|nr:FG-GAP-like repeat-containing protein [Chryseolinea lacunae]MBL0741562.1 T9SS type A sorting domain-containing protein [Chryseolinea lacunae]
MTNLLRLLLLLLPVSLQAQFTYEMVADVPVKNSDGTAVNMPWVGGLNAAQYNTMDLDHDGKDDLVLFDRMADRVITFLNRDNTYVAAPQYESFFPAEITNWLLLRDFNCDGQKDIFTGDILGIKVFTNTTASGQTPSWKQFLFYSGPGGTKSQVLLSKGFSGLINVQLQFDDLPSLLDADGDGDLDLFDVRFVGDGTVEYHKNFSQERYGRCDSLVFERQTQKWGGVTECSCGTFAFNGDPCPPITGGRPEHAGGKSLLVMDVNGDATLDMLFSEATCSNLYLLSNTGTLDAPVITTSSTFPQLKPISFLVYPAAFYEDLDFDGRKDIVSIPNIFAKLYLNSDLSHSNWFYKNTGTSAAPVFTFSQDNFLQDRMVDVGDNSVPAFFDYDADGDYDLFVSQNTSDPGSVFATVKLYKNTGTASQPEFTLANDDMFGFSALSIYNLKIQFADFDADKKTDLVFTATTLQGSTALYYVSNKTGLGVDFGGQPVQNTGFTIFQSENITVVDVNQDGFGDLLVGKSNGSLEYWKNNGQVNSFTMVTNAFLGLSSTVLRQNLSTSVADLDADGKSDLLIGDQDGHIGIISDFRTVYQTKLAVNIIRDITYNALLADADKYENRNFGGRIWTAPVNLYNTTKPSVVIGNALGGLFLLRHDGGESLPENPVISVYPNPTLRNSAITVKADRSVEMQIFSSLGHRVTDRIRVPGGEEFTYRLGSMASGVYIIRFTENNKSFVSRLVVY